MPRGRLIVFEGPEGAGKTTQLRLARRAGSRARGQRRRRGARAGRHAGRRRDPPPAARSGVRHRAARRGAAVHGVARAARRARDPAGARARRDRARSTGSFSSTYAYQGAGRGFRRRACARRTRMATDGLVPDLTLLLTLPVEEGLARATRRGGHDRMERAELAFHERVARAFDDVSRRRRGRRAPRVRPDRPRRRQRRPKRKCSTACSAALRASLARKFRLGDTQSADRTSSMRHVHCSPASC